MTLTPRGRSVLALGLVVYVAAWAFGSKPLYPVAAGLLVVSVVAWAWVHLANGTYRIVRASTGAEQVEGDDVPVSVTAEPGGLVAPPVACLAESIGALGEQRHVMRRRGRRLHTAYTLERLRRGRYAFTSSRIEIADPFGLQQIVIPLAAPGSLLVYPRVVALARLFSEAGAHGLDGRRLLLRRPTGYDLHSVREYTQGESLRNVHWRSTARRGDASAEASVGESFDVQVRAAASILEAFASRGRRAVLVVDAARRAEQRVDSAAEGRRRALELLASVEPTGRGALASVLGDHGSGAARALELVVVTARLDSRLVERMVERVAGRRRTSLVYVDAATFAGAPAQRLPALLRLQAAGVPVAVVRADDDLRAALEGENGVRLAGHA
jgi:uncharacterized protein (DUF58 family)